MADGPSIYPSFRYRDAGAAIDFLRDAFGFEEVARYDNDDGTVAHAELRYGDGMIMLGSHREGDRYADHVGSGWVYVVVDDAEAHHARAVQHGAQITMELTDQDYGSRDYAARDPEGNTWNFGTYRPSLEPHTPG
jgi:uncharacterized glyoxalase superfamily protein PhnB